MKTKLNINSKKIYEAVDVALRVAEYELSAFRKKFDCSATALIKSRRRRIKVKIFKEKKAVE